MNEPAARPRELPVRAITDREFRAVQELVYREAGIALGPTKQALVTSRLARHVKELRLDTIGAYLRHVEEHRGPELVAMLDAITTNETHFFREARHFELLEERIFPHWKAQAQAGERPKRLRIWSAACSTGEEPYSLAMVLLSHFPAAEGWQCEIIGTDLSTRVLARAEEALWPVEKAREIPDRLLKRFMLRGVGSQSGKMKVSPALRAAVRFARLNLNDERYPVAGPFDLIFCRNVMIYFDLASKRRVVGRLFDRLAPDGLLFLGHSETLTGVTDRGGAIVPTLYAHAPARLQLAEALGGRTRAGAAWRASA